MGAKLSKAKNLAKKTASFMYFLQDRIVILNVQDLYFPYIFQKNFLNLFSSILACQGGPGGPFINQGEGRGGMQIKDYLNYCGIGTIIAHIESKENAKDKCYKVNITFFIYAY